MPMFIERKYYTDAHKMEVARRIQVVLGTSSDFLTGTLLLYMFYNNAKHQLKKRIEIKARIERQRKLTTGTESRKATTA